MSRLRRILSAVAAWYRGRSNATKASINSAWQSFVATAGLALSGWLADVAEWAGDTARPFPAVSPVGKAVMAAAVSAVTAAVTFLVRAAQARRDPGAGPQYRG